MNLLNKFIAASSVLFIATAAQADPVTVVEEIANSGFGVWKFGDMRDGGTAGIVSLSGLGGNLENNAPLPNDAVRFTTGVGNNNDKGEIVIEGDFGTVTDIFTDGLSFSYDYYRENVDGANAFAAPAMKLGFLATDCETGEDCYFQLIFEPYQNGGVVDGAWTNVAIDMSSGTFWTTGGFGWANGGGGCPCNTLTTIEAGADGNFADAHLVSVALGLGTYNQGVTGYVDNVSINAGNFSETYDFELTEVPAPAPLALLGIGLIGLMRRRKG